MSEPKQLEIPVSLGKPSLRIRLEAYYSLINPESIQDPIKWRNTFQQIYEKYGGSYEGEKKLAAKLAKKYGTTVRLLLAESVLEKQQTKSPTKRYGLKEESWYQLKPTEQDSNVIDFTSDRFDPQAALKLPTNQIMLENPWVQESPLLNHLGQCRSLLSPNDPLYRDPPSQSNNQKKAPPSQATKPKKLGPFAAIAENHKTGPWSFLNRLFSKRQRVRVLVRYVNRIRGTLTGYLVAYDKHCNMILKDVDEVYSPRCRGGETDGDEPPSNLEAELKRRRNGLEQTRTAIGSQNTTEWQLRQRHMKQILVRGDNVVMVYKAESERSTWPPTSKSPAKSVHGRKAAAAVPDHERVGSPGSLIYALQQQQARRGQTNNQRYDYSSSNNNKG